MKKIHKNSTGIAGVYFVASELTRKGYIASPTLGNTPGIDILAANYCGDRYVFIQVKTSINQVSTWPLGAGAVPKNMRGKDSYYAFVRDDGNERFEVFVVSGNEVYKGNQKHMRKAERRGVKAWYAWHLPKGREDKYLNNWKKLRLGA